MRPTSPSPGTAPSISVATLEDAAPPNVTRTTSSAGSRPDRHHRPARTGPRDAPPPGDRSSTETP